MAGRRCPRLGSPLSLLLLLAAAAFYLVPLRWATNRFDAGIAVVAAQRILRGDVPYVDFQTLYTPGQYFVTAAAFSVFGTTFDVASRVGVVTMAVQAWLAWHVAVRISGSRFTALLAFFAALAFEYPYPALTIAFAALLVADVAVHRRSFGAALGAGALAGLAAWFRQDTGFACAVAVMATLWTGTPGPARLRVGRAVAAGGVAAVVLAMLLVPAIFTAPSRLFEGLVTNPAATVPYRSADGGFAAGLRAEWFVGVILLLAAIGGVLGLAGMVRRPDPSKALLAGASVMTLWAFRYLCLRPDAHHLVPAGILVGVLGARAMPRVGWLRLAVFSACAAAVAVPFVNVGGARAAELLGRRVVSVVPIGDWVPGARSLCLPADEAGGYRRLVERVRALVPPGKPFLSACKRHDVIHDQDLVLWFVTDRPAVPFDWHFDPGVTTREDVQRRLIADCEAADIRVVVRYEGPSHDEPVAGPAGSHVLDEWLAAKYARAESIGRYEIWTRN